ncbi:MAG: hypothetical protein AB7S80_09370 [Rhizobiaceae bacterium]
MGIGIFGGVWAVVMLAVFIQAIRLSYRIEARSKGLKNTSGLPRKAMIVHTVLNISVARDVETQAMRRRMNRLLLVNAAGFVVFAIGIRFFAPAV